MNILRANANRNNDLQSAVFDGGRRTAPLSAPLYALCQIHIVALAAAAQPAKHNIVVLCNRGQYITGLWKITDIHAVGKDFKMTWRTAEELAAAEDVHPMQKAMAKALYLFEADGTLKQLFPKELDRDGEYPVYDEQYVIGKVTKWKEENGKLLFDSGEKGEVLGETVSPWRELVPVGDMLQMGAYRLAKEV